MVGDKENDCGFFISQGQQAPFQLKIFLLIIHPESSCAIQNQRLRKHALLTFIVLLYIDIAPLIITFLPMPIYIHQGRKNVICILKITDLIHFAFGATA